MIKFNLSVPVTDGRDLTEIAAKKLRVKIKGAVKILKKSVDARDKGNILYVYTVAAETDEVQKAVKNGGTEYTLPKNSLDDLTEGLRYHGRPVVVGTGPAGLFAALTLCKLGAKPIIIERGEAVEDRRKKVDVFFNTLKLDVNSNILFGEGGAGTFSDGKLNTGINSPFVPAVLQALAFYGAPEEIVYLNKPHVGTDMLEKTVKNMREALIDYGAEILFGTKLTDLVITDGKITGVVTDKGKIDTDKVYLAIGHSARDTFEMLYAKGVKMTSKIFSMGVRIEHLQTDISKSQYGKGYSQLPPADYKAAVKLSGGNNLYTFCMCPGGTVVNASSEEGGICVNGMSNYLRDGVNANSALLINVTEREYGEGVLAGVEYQRKLERAAYKLSGGYRAPVQTFGDFVKGKAGEPTVIKPSIATGYVNCDLNEILPDFISEGLKEGIPLIGKRIRGFDTECAVLTGVETRSSSPVRILRDENCEANIRGLFPLGEGAGYAGGITSAAADGIRGVLSSIGA